MPIVVMAGVSHHTAGLAELEQFTLTAAGRALLLRRVLAEGFAEAAVLSTCSRVELYAIGAEPDAPSQVAADRLRRLLIETVGEDAGAAGCAARHGDQAVTHLFRVTAGLDSRLIGESDIQAQVSAAAHGAVGTPRDLPRLVTAALAAARSVHARTALGGVGRSLGVRALERGLAVAGPLLDRRVVIVGSGTMARLVVQAVAARDLIPVLLARDLMAAQRLRGDGAHLHPMTELASELAQVSLAIVATSADHQLITAEQAHRAVHRRAGRPLTIVDLAVPRNVDAAVGAVAGVVLLNVDALHDSAPDSVLQEQIELAEQLTAQAAGQYATDQRVRAAGLFVHQLREQVSARCRQQLLAVTGDALDLATLDRATQAVLGPVLHAPSVLIKAAAADGDTALLNRLADAYRTSPAALPPAAVTQRAADWVTDLATSYQPPDMSAGQLDQSWPC